MPKRGGTLLHNLNKKQLFQRARDKWRKLCGVRSSALCHSPRPLTFIIIATRCIQRRFPLCGSTPAARLRRQLPRRPTAARATPHDRHRGHPSSRYASFTIFTRRLLTIRVYSGSGSYGTVFAARIRQRMQWHELDVEGATVAVKVITKRSIRDQEPVRDC